LHAQRIDCQNPDSYREKRNKKMPYEEFRRLFEKHHEVRPSRWQRITRGNTTKWALAGMLCVVAALLMR